MRGRMPERQSIAMAWRAPAFNAATSVLPSVATDSIASASFSLAFSIWVGLSPKLLSDLPGLVEGLSHSLDRLRSEGCTIYELAGSHGR